MLKIKKTLGILCNAYPRLIERLTRMECKSCRHSWLPYTPERLRICPKCKSPYLVGRTGRFRQWLQRAI